MSLTTGWAIDSRDYWEAEAKRLELLLIASIKREERAQRALDKLHQDHHELQRDWRLQK